MFETPHQPSVVQLHSRAALMEARVVLTQPSALDFLQEWDRALERACEVTRLAGVPDLAVEQVCEEVRQRAAATAEGPEWVLLHTRRRLHALVHAAAQWPGA